MARALARQGVTVHCLSDSQTPDLPTTRTRYATVHFRRGLNSGPLASFLSEIADEIGSTDKIVLFPTSDRIAKAVATAWDALDERYALSWSHCRNLVLELQRKDYLAMYCDRAGVRHPRSRSLSHPEDCQSVAESLQFPLVVKPAQPLSSFKAIRLDDLAGLRWCVSEYSYDLPFVVQEWIDGPEPSLYSCTTYLDHGSPLYLFISRKIAAQPPGLGQGTVFETHADRQTEEIAARFLRQLDLSGPVAVEFKRDAAGRFWVIEPNVGRTEYCVDLAVQSGFNLPYIEYLQVAGRSAEITLPARSRGCVWFDTDKDPACFLANIGVLRDQSGRIRRPVFPYFGHGDWRPLAGSIWNQVSRVPRGVAKRIWRMMSRIGS